MRVFIIVLSLLLFSCKSNKELKGEIIGHTEFKDVSVFQSLIGVENGNYYFLETASGEIYLIYTGIHLDVLNVSLKGTFIVGGQMFKGTGENYKDKKLNKIKVTAYKLIQFKND